MVAPDKLIFPVPASAVIMPPPQEPLSPLGVAITSGDGSRSVNPTLVSAIGFGLLMLKDRLDVVLFTTRSGLNTLVRTGGPKTTILAVAVPPVPPSVELMVPVVLT
jgi:hypothetical protein